jgi:hypothetical protein
VVVVQQRREQRRRRCDAAAALRQRERGLLVHDQFAQQAIRPRDDVPAPLVQRDAHRQGVDEHAGTRSAPSVPCRRPTTWCRTRRRRGPCRRPAPAPSRRGTARPRSRAAGAPWRGSAR